jgi:small-conductance mechanosensitive channel
VKGLQRSVSLYFWVVVFSSVCFIAVFAIAAAADRLKQQIAEVERKIDAATVKTPAGPVERGSIRVEQFDEKGNRIAYNIDTKASDNEALAEAGDQLDDVLRDTKMVLAGLCMLAPVVLTIGVLAIWSTFLLTAREPGTSGDDRLRKWRLIMRISPFFMVPFVMLKPFAGGEVWIVDTALCALGVLLFVGQELFLCEYAQRIPDYELEQTTEKIMGWLTKLPAAAIFVAIAMSFVAPAFLQNNATIIVSVLFTIWGVLLIRYLILLRHFRAAFRNAVRDV